MGYRAVAVILRRKKRKRRRLKVRKPTTPSTMTRVLKISKTSTVLKMPAKPFLLWKAKISTRPIKMRFRPKKKKRKRRRRRKKKKCQRNLSRQNHHLDAVGPQEKINLINIVLLYQVGKQNNDQCAEQQDNWMMDKRNKKNTISVIGIREETFVKSSTILCCLA